jgi:hypothetical protein
MQSLDPGAASGRTVRPRTLLRDRLVPQGERAGCSTPTCGRWGTQTMSRHDPTPTLIATCERALVSVRLGEGQRQLPLLRMAAEGGSLWPAVFRWIGSG